jgi:hypothetical protein
MTTTRIFPIILASILLLCITFPLNYVQSRDLTEEIEDCNYSINKMEKYRKGLENIKQKVDSGKYYIIREKGIPKLVSKDDFIKKTEKPWEVLNKTDSAKKNTKSDYEKILGELRIVNYYLSREKERLDKLEKELNEQHQEGRGYIEVKINQEKFTRPRKNLVRWDWQLRFDEINGVGVTIKKGLAKGYRGGELKLNKVDSLNIRIEPYGSAFLSDPYMQFSTIHNKTGPGKMKFIYSGIDDNGNEVKTELEITRYPK